MNSLAFVAFIAAFAATYAAPSATILQGPSAKSTVVGADGSVISSIAPGGQIVAEEYPGVVAHSAPLPVASALTYSYAHAPVVDAHTAYSYSAPVVSAYAAPVVTSYAAPGVLGHSAVDTVISGPSGTIATSKTVASPAVVAAHGVYGFY